MGRPLLRTGVASYAHLFTSGRLSVLAAVVVGLLAAAGLVQVAGAAPSSLLAVNGLPCYAQVEGGSTFSSSNAQAVQDAVDAAPLSGTVKIAGACAGVASRNGSDQTVYITQSVTLRGGYTYADWDTSDPVANPTILDALDLGRVLLIASGEAVEVDGLILQNGYSDDSGGAGLYNEANALIVVDSVLRDHDTDGNGSASVTDDYFFLDF